ICDRTSGGRRSLGFCDASFRDLLSGQAEKGRSVNSEDCEIHVDLSAMVDFVFDHCAQPFPSADLRAAGSLALSQELRVREIRDQCNGFTVETLHEKENVVETRCQFLPATRIGITVSGGRARKNVSVGRSDVPGEIAERKFS